MHAARFDTFFHTYPWYNKVVVASEMRNNFAGITRKFVIVVLKYSDDLFAECLIRCPCQCIPFAAPFHEHVRHMPNFMAPTNP